MLVVEPTHLKHAYVELDHSPRYGVNIKRYLKPPPRYSYLSILAIKHVQPLKFFQWKGGREGWIIHPHYTAQKRTHVPRRWAPVTPNSERPCEISSSKSVPSWPSGAISMLGSSTKMNVFSMEPKEWKVFWTCFFRMIFRFHVGFPD